MEICIWYTPFDFGNGVSAFAFGAAAYVDFGMLMGELIDSLQTTSSY